MRFISVSILFLFIFFQNGAAEASSEQKIFSLGFDESYFLNDSSQLIGPKHLEEGVGRLRLGERYDLQNDQDFTAVLDVGGRYGINVPDYKILYAPEFYLSYSARANDVRYSLRAGRKKERWSELDSFWQLELWQPQVRWDYLRPEDQGMSGLFFGIESGDWRATAFYSPFFIPEQGPSFHLVNSHFTSESPWFVAPVTIATLLYGQTDIRFALNTPPLEKLLVHNSAGAMLEWGTQRHGLWARVNYAYKQRNQVMTPFNASLVLSPGDTHAAVNVEPKVIDEHIGGVDVGWRSRVVSMWLSAVGFTYLNNGYSSDLDYQFLHSGVFLSPLMDIQVWQQTHWNLHFIASYLKLIDGGFDQRGPDDLSATPVFMNPYLYSEALRVGAKTSVTSAIFKKISGAFFWTTTLANQENWLSATADAALDEHFSLGAGLDLINSAQSNQSKSFLSVYRGNDRLLAHALYLF